MYTIRHKTGTLFKEFINFAKFCKDENPYWKATWPVLAMAFLAEELAAQSFGTHSLTYRSLSSKSARLKQATFHDPGFDCAPRDRYGPLHIDVKTMCYFSDPLPDWWPVGKDCQHFRKKGIYDCVILYNIPERRVYEKDLLAGIIPPVIEFFEVGFIEKKTIEGFSVPINTYFEIYTHHFREIG